MDSMAVPAVRYARANGVSLAYQIYGSGPLVVTVPPAAQNIELAWESPLMRTLLERMGSFCRHVHFDKRGTGVSDRTVGVPTMDQRVEDLRAVMDDVGAESAYLVGVSEGGPMALQFAATYPERVDGVVLLTSGARIYGDMTAEEAEVRRVRAEHLLDVWGTDASVSLDLWAPSLAGDAAYRAWHVRYERQCASPSAIRELFAMVRDIDVRPLLPLVDAPTLVIHRRHDPILPLALADEVVAGVRDARLVVVEGHDHFAHAGDVHAWLDEIEAFVTGGVATRPATRPASRRGPASGRAAVLSTMGGFAAVVDGEEVPQGAWGSRRARQLCKRLAVGGYEPVPRDELIELLWPDEPDPSRAGPRLSVLLSNIRRVLGGGIIADRAAVRLDPATVRVDIHELYRALRDGDDAGAVAGYRGPVLPEDAYDDWAALAGERLALALVGAHRRLSSAASSAGHHQEVVEHAQAILALDPYDELAHEQLVHALAATGRHGDAARADQRYRARMAELGVTPRPLLAPPLSA